MTSYYDSLLRRSNNEGTASKKQGAGYRVQAQTPPPVFFLRVLHRKPGLVATLLYSMLKPDPFIFLRALRAVLRGLRGSNLRVQGAVSRFYRK